MIVASALAAVLVVSSVALAWLWSPARPNSAEQARDAIERAFKRGVVPAADLNHRRWTALFGFGPLTTRDAVLERTGIGDLDGNFARVGPGERILVFADRDHVVATTRLRSQAIETACIAAGHATGVRPTMDIRVLAIPLGGRTVLAAAAGPATAALRECLRAMPTF